MLSFEREKTPRSPRARGELQKGMKNMNDTEWEFAKGFIIGFIVTPLVGLLVFLVLR